MPITMLVLILTAAAVAALGDEVVNMTAMRDEVKEMFEFGFTGYMKHGWPKDEVQPGGCRGVDSLGGLGVTLVDSLDMLVVVGEEERFCEEVERVGGSGMVDFDRDVNVSVFEVTIRVLGGLLSAHVLLETHVHCPTYTGHLLAAAHDLGIRLLPAFSTPTGIPYGTVNLRHGVPHHETPLTSLAGGGTNLIEFTALSILTSDPRFKIVSTKALTAFYATMSPLNLLGSHINISSGIWTHRDSGIGGNTDSYYEYLAKGYALFGCEKCLEMFWGTYKGVRTYIYQRPWWVEADMYSGEIVWPLLGSLTAFYQGVLFNLGEYGIAEETIEATHAVWRRCGGLPEGYSFLSHMPHPRQSAYPLRPELAESIWQLYRATKDPLYLKMGVDMVKTIETRSKGKCGYHTLENVLTGEKRDQMESFFLSETLKYLYLLYDEDNFLNSGEWVMNTEGHPFPINSEFANALSDLGMDRAEERKKTQCGRISEWRRFTVDGFKA